LKRKKVPVEANEPGTARDGAIIFSDLIGKLDEHIAG
jgi:hypothetical protein